MAYSWGSSVSAARSASSAAAVTVSATFAAHDRVQVLICYGSGTTLTETVSDGTNTYVQRSTGNISANGETYSIYECLDAASGTFTVSFTPGAAVAFCGVAVFNQSGLDNTTAMQVINNIQATPGTATDALTSTNLTPASQPGMLLGISIDDKGNAASVAAGTGFTDRSTIANFDSGNGVVSRVEDKRLTATTAVSATATATGTGSGNFITFGVFIPEGASSTVTQRRFRARNDDGSESAATFYAAEDTNFTAAKDVNRRLRFLLDAGGDPASKQFRLDYKLSTDSTYVPVLVSAPSNPTFQAAGTAVGSTTTAAPAWPTHQSGDIALLFVESAGGEAVTLSSAAGFVEITNSPQATGATTSGTRLHVYWCRATSSAMSAPTVADPGNHVYAQILTFRGCIAEGNPWDVTGGGVKASASTSLSHTGVTTTVANCLIVMAVTSDADAATAFLSAQADASLSSLTEQVDAGTTQGNGGGIAVTTGVLAAAGASGTMTATVVSSINAFMTIALRPQTTPIMMSASSNITAGGEATTALLTPPSGKLTSDFDTGRIWDDENGTDSLDITTDNYTEVEWCIKALAANGVSDGQVYNLRVTAAGTALDTYTVTPAWTIGSAASAPPPVNPSARANRMLAF